MARKGERRIWTQAEARAFLFAYLGRKEEFADPLKKKSAMENVLLDLESQGVLTQPATVETLSSKLKNLLRAYKETTGTNRRVDAAPCIAPFLDLLDEIFGKNPKIGNKHSINLCDVPVEMEKANLHEVLSDVEVVSPISSTQTLKPNKTQERRKRSERKISIYLQYLSDRSKERKASEMAKQRRHEEKMALLRQIVEKMK